MSEIEPPVPPEEQGDATVPPKDTLTLQLEKLTEMDLKMKDHGNVITQHTLELQAIKQAVTSINDKTADSTP